MSNLRRRLQKLEARLTDSSGLVPHSPAWHYHWASIMDRLIGGAEDESDDHRSAGIYSVGIPLEYIDALGVCIFLNGRP